MIEMVLAFVMLIVMIMPGIYAMKWLTNLKRSWLRGNRR